MRRAAIAIITASLLALPAGAAAKAKTSTPIRVRTPSPGNATVTGFKLKLERVKKKKAKRALLAAGVPKNVTVYAVLAKQKRSDRVSGVLVAVNRSATVTATSAARRRTFRVKLKFGKLPRGFRLTSVVKQRADVLSRGRSFSCGGYIRTSDLANAGTLAGPSLSGITIGTIFQSACASAKSAEPYPTLGEFRYALNARAGVMTFAASPQFPNEVNGAAGFNFPVQAFGVLADASHTFTNCGFSGGTCAVQTVAHPNDYVLFTLPAPAAAGTSLAFALAMTPNPTPSLPFRFFGDMGGTRLGPLLTKGP
jgi:hypothetical protein